MFQVSCRVLFTIQLRYLRLSTYTWMLSEGWYLHRLLIAAFSEPKSLRAYYLVCWGKKKQRMTEGVKGGPSCRGARRD